MKMKTENRFYDLPLELINKVYSFDNTYKDIYNKVICMIEKFPVFHKEEFYSFVFLKEYNMYNNIPIKEYLSVSQKYRFKKAVFMIINKMSKPGTLIC